MKAKKSVSHRRWTYYYPENGTPKKGHGGNDLTKHLSLPPQQAPRRCPSSVS